MTLKTLLMRKEILIAVLGAGHSSLKFIRLLTSVLNYLPIKYKIDLYAESAEFCFLPLTPNVLDGSLTLQDITTPITSFANKYSVCWVPMNISVPGDAGDETKPEAHELLDVNKYTFVFDGRRLSKLSECQHTCVISQIRAIRSNNPLRLNNPTLDNIELAIGLISAPSSNKHIKIKLISDSHKSIQSHPVYKQYYRPYLSRSILHRLEHIDHDVVEQQNPQLPALYMHDTSAQRASRYAKLAVGSLLGTLFLGDLKSSCFITTRQGMRFRDRGKMFYHGFQNGAILLPFSKYLVTGQLPAYLRRLYYQYQFFLFHSDDNRNLSRIMIFTYLPYFLAWTLVSALLGDTLISKQIQQTDSSNRLNNT